MRTLAGRVFEFLRKAQRLRVKLHAALLRGHRSELGTIDDSNAGELDVTLGERGVSVRHHECIHDAPRCLSPDQISLLEWAAREHKLGVEALQLLERLQYAIMQEIEVLAQQVAFCGIGEQQPEMIGDQVVVVPALAVHRLLHVGPTVEGLVRLPMTVSAQGDAVAPLQPSLRKEALPNDVVRRQTFCRVARDAPSAIANPNELAPESHAVAVAPFAHDCADQFQVSRLDLLNHGTHRLP
ncbi:MAG: hypothetical protein KY464_12420 [Gemmatimonadetes bacterium]|nr:hypothetical protein [Gemmatimonadota bacterium]